MSNIGSSKISEIYVGSTKIAQAYVGSTLVFKLAGPPSLDYVTIGSQTWTSKNLAIDDGQGGIYTQTVNFGQGDIVEYYYTWDAAVRVANSVSGWHLASKTEWETLVSTIGSSTAGTKLKSTYGWSSVNGTDNYGFTVLPVGYRNGTRFYSLNSLGMFWTSTQSSSTYAYYKYFNSKATMSNATSGKSNYALSIRLVQDAT